MIESGSLAAVGEKTLERNTQVPVADKSSDREIQTGDRFGFGENWARFLACVDERRIRLAEQSLRTMLATDTLDGKTFLDIGSGSGLFSLAARRLGAKVRSFDYDRHSVACTAELKRRYCPEDPDWQVELGSVLDQEYLGSLGRYDILYSWGVLHHTGAMYQSLDNISSLVAENGLLFIAIYNDQGGQSRRWRRVKIIYNGLPGFLRIPFAVMVMAPREGVAFMANLLRGKPWSYFANIFHYAEQETRGMSWWRDIVDWVGGLPFEVAKPEEILDFYRARGFELIKLQTEAGGLGCNQFVFRVRH